MSSHSPSEPGFAPILYATYSGPILRTVPTCNIWCDSCGYNSAVTCCEEFDRMVDLEVARHAQPWQLTDGRLLTEIDTEYFLISGGERRTYVGINYCPFCGRALSRGLWNLEK